MSTNSTISMKKQDGTIISIYCHWDGNIEHNGKILFKHYQDPEKIEELIEGGDLSVLDRHIGHKIKFTDYEERKNNNQCLYYSRDRGEDGVDKNTYTNENQIQNQEYNYLWKDGKWYVKKQNKTNSFVIELEHVLNLD